MAVPFIEPMLATNREPTRGHSWAIEPKLDGWRALVYVDGGVLVRSRRGRDMTSALLELTGLADAVPDGTVLDGEVVADGGRGADFYKVGPSIAARGPEVRLAFVAFDVPHLAGDSTLRLSYEERRRLLEQLELDGPAWCTMAVFYEDANDVLAECSRLHLEGLVAKRVDSRYEPGKRSVHWRKLQCAGGREHHAPGRHES